MSNAENVHAPPPLFSGNDISTGVPNYLNSEDKLSKAQYDRSRKARRIFVLARMQKASRTAQKFSNPKPAGTEIERLFRNSFQIWQSENADLEQIVLRFSGRAAQLVRERNWHSSQQIQELASGNLELFFTLNSLEEIVPWILSWGRACEVVRPVKLQRKVRSLSA